MLMWARFSASVQTDPDKGYWAFYLPVGGLKLPGWHTVMHGK